MFKKLLGKTKAVPQTLDLKAHATGEIVKLADVPDPVFAQKMMGDGIAIDPLEGKITSPIDGEIVQVFPTKHAVGIKAENGTEVLIHIGLDTVSMKGEGFTTHVSTGKKVKVGDLLVTFDVALVKEKAESTITPMIITNTDNMETISKLIEAGSVEAGNQSLLSVTIK